MLSFLLNTGVSFSYLHSITLYNGYFICLLSDLYYRALFHVYLLTW